MTDDERRVYELMFHQQGRFINELPVCRQDLCQQGKKPCPIPSACQVPLDDGLDRIVPRDWQDWVVKLGVVLVWAMALAAVFS